MIPTIVLRTPALLSYLSMIGTIATTAVCLSVVTSAFVEGDISQEVANTFGFAEESHHMLWNTTGLTMALGLIAYCFSGHAIVPSIYTSMKRPQDFETMVTVTYLIVLAACLCVGAGGYYMFGDTVLDQITLSLEQNSSADKAMQALTGLMVLTGTYRAPLQMCAHRIHPGHAVKFFVPTRGIFSYFSAFSKVTLTMFPLALGMEELLAPYLTEMWMVSAASSAIKLSITLLAISVGIYVPSFSFICALVGMVCTMSVSVIFPAAAHLKMFGSKLPWYDWILDISFVLIGLIMAIVGTISTVV
jgi:vesicular inhibitory amino acid transporter